MGDREWDPHASHQQQGQREIASGREATQTL
jgi:hypothetical protein